MVLHRPSWPRPPTKTNSKIPFLLKHCVFSSLFWRYHHHHHHHQHDHHHHHAYCYQPHHHERHHCYDHHHHSLHNHHQQVSKTITITSITTITTNQTPSLSYAHHITIFITVMTVIRRTHFC